MANFLATALVCFAISWAAISGVISLATGKPFAQCLMSTHMSCEAR